MLSPYGAGGRPPRGNRAGCRASGKQVQGKLGKERIFFTEWMRTGASTQRALCECPGLLFLNVRFERIRTSGSPTTYIPIITC